MILLACIVVHVCVRMKSIQYIDILHKGAETQRPQIDPVRQNCITHDIKIFQHV